jgi:hypothetical protein
VAGSLEDLADAAREALLIEEGRNVLEARARSETILLAAWTRPTAGTADEVIHDPAHEGAVDAVEGAEAEIRVLRFASRGQLLPGRQKGLAVEALIEEGRNVLEARARSETILLAAWT